MKKINFFEKFGKLLFSIILTGVLVTGLVFAASWDILDDGDAVTGANWQQMVAHIKAKVNPEDLIQFYTKTEADTKFITEVNIPSIVMAVGGFRGNSSLNNIVTKPTCSSGYSPEIQVNLDWFETVGDVDGNDIIGTWSVDNGSTWSINGGDYDCGSVAVSGRITKTCGIYNDSKISYTAYCTSVFQVSAECGVSEGTCDVGTPGSVNAGIWNCTEGSSVKSCGTYQDPCLGGTPPSYCYR